jgi:hypothetical protein
VENKKLIVILGGSIDFYHNSLNLLKKVEEKTGWKIRRDDFENFSMQIDNTKIEIKFCWNPTRDLNYEEMKEYAKTKLKFIVHNPADELAKTIKSVDGILFLGHCGTLKGNKEEIYIPTKFTKLFFSTPFVLRENLEKNTPSEKLIFKNCLSQKINGKDACVITSNLTLCPENMQDKDEEILIKLAKHLMKYGDVVEKESYSLIKLLKNKCPFGIAMISSDVISVKEHMIRETNFNPDKDNFVNLFVKSTKVMLKEINKSKA